MNTNCPVITLNNGITIANWSSPHEFKFTTGEVLPACTPERVNAMSIDIDETVVSNKKWDDIKIKTSIPDVVQDDLKILQDDEDIDIILVPFMVQSAMKSLLRMRYPYFFKLRVIRVADRVTKEIYPDRFCI